MSRKAIKAPKKIKPNTSRPPAKPVLHVQWLRAYHEVLKHEDVLDVELDVIYDAFQDVIKDTSVSAKMSDEPDGMAIEIVVSKVMEQLCGN